MEEEAAAAADSPRKSGRKRTRKRAYTRKASLSTTFINMAEARREIVNALHLHRSSTARNNAPAPTHHHQLTDSMPLPEPTWSTTAPAVICAPLPAVEVLEVEWFHNDVSASCSWWVAFLSSLDRKISAEGPPPAAVPGLGAEDSGSGRDEKAPFMDEWVVLPPGEE